VFHAPFLEFHGLLLGSWERSKKLIQLDYPELKSYPTLEAVLEADVDLVVVNTQWEPILNMPKKYCWRGNTHSRKSIYYNCCRSTGTGGIGKSNA
jgi:hypothetical protein